MARRKEVVTLEDPRALRALAHPARQRLIGELFGGRVLTATEAADIVGLTPSAVSHHLRVLERWGLARRAESTGDARERPWQATARRVNLRSRAGAGNQAAMQSVLAAIHDDFATDVNRFVANADDEPWGKTYQAMVRGELWLTRDEARQLSKDVEALIAPLERGRSATRHPKDARRAAMTWSLVPTEPAPEG
jgi:DNA-binding transcriptional ArsR family regulator